MGLFLLSLAVFAVVMLAMAVGVIFKYPCLRDSCGGSEVVGPDGRALSCATCPNGPGVALSSTLALLRFPHPSYPRQDADENIVIAWCDGSQIDKQPVAFDPCHHWRG